MKNVLIIEDNQQSLKALEKISYEADSHITVHPASDLSSAYLIAMEQDISLFLIDIILSPEKSGDTSGLSFAQKIRQIEKYRFTPIIFVTSLEDPKLHAYSHIHCYGYLEKPYDPEIARNLIAEALMFPHPSESEKERYIYFRKDKVIYPRKLSEIAFFENMGRRLTVHMQDGEQLIMPYRTCASLMKDLDSDRFVQCSRSTILNLDYIDNIDPQNRYIHLKGMDSILEIGSILKKKFLKEIENHK